MQIYKKDDFYEKWRKLSPTKFGEFGCYNVFDVPKMTKKILIMKSNSKLYCTLISAISH